MSTNNLQSTQTADRGHAESAYEAVLIFERECPFCSAAATAFRRLSEVDVIAWNDDATQRFLAAQSDEPPFTLVFVDGVVGRLWLGPAAEGELCDRAGLPTLVQDIVADAFERVGDTVREAVSANRQPVDFDGTRSLTATATAEYRTLAANGQSTHGTREFH